MMSDDEILPSKPSSLAVNVKSNVDWSSEEPDATSGDGELNVNVGRGTGITVVFEKSLLSLIHI